MAPSNRAARARLTVVVLLAIAVIAAAAPALLALRTARASTVEVQLDGVLDLHAGERAAGVHR